MDEYPIDWIKVAFWVAVLIFCAAFWFGVVEIAVLVTTSVLP